MDVKPSIQVDWYIVFTRSKYKSWLMNMLNQDFSHVYAMRKSEGGQFWQIINPLISYISVELVTIDEYPHPRCWAESDAVILPVTAKIADQARWTFCVFNCVEVIKGLLGIKSFWTLTPWQLYKHLRRHKNG